MNKLKPFKFGIRSRNSSNKALGVFVLWIKNYLLRSLNFNDPTMKHYCYPISNLIYNSHIMSY